MLLATSIRRPPRRAPRPRRCGIPEQQEKLVPACKTPESGGFDKTKPTRGKTWSEGERIGSGDVPQPYWPVR